MPEPYTDYRVESAGWPATNYTDEPVTALMDACAKRLVVVAKSLRENSWNADCVVARDPDSGRITMSVVVELRPADALDPTEAPR